MNSFGQSIKDNPIYSLLGGGVLLLLVFGAGYLLNPAFQVNNLRTLISVMIAAQASVLAIVISVTLISTQLVATRYAPRMATLPFRTPLFSGAFSLFAVSIILDVFLLFGVSPTTSSLYSGVLFVAVVLFFSILPFLYYFVPGMVGHTSPENLVTLFTGTISAEEYLNQSQAYAEAPEQNAHPLQPLFRFIMSSISRNEYGTARTALDQYHQYASQIMDELDDKGVFADDSPDTSDELFDPVVDEHLHLITIHAAENDESQILTSAIDAQVDLGKQGMAIGGKIRVPSQSLSGLRRTIIEAPVDDEDHSTFNRAWPAIAELMLEETNYTQNRVLISGKNIFKVRLASALHRSNEPRWHTEALGRVFENLCEAHVTVVENIGNGPGFDEIDLRENSSIQDTPAKYLIDQARYTREAIFGATSTFLQFRIDEGYWPATDGNFFDEWEELCISVASSGPDDYAIYLCQTLIEMAFMENLHRPYDRPKHGILVDEGDENLNTDYLYWTRELANIEENTSSPVVEQAFDNILQYSYEEGPTPIRVSGDGNNVEEQYYFPILPINDYRALNTYTQFPGLIEEMRNRSLQD